MRYRALCNELQKLAGEELNEVPYVILHGIRRLRKWIRHQMHIHHKADDQWILNFLRCCKYDLEKTKEKIDTYFWSRYFLKQLFIDRNPFQTDIQRVLSYGICLPLIDTTEKNAPRIILYRWHSNLNSVRCTQTVLKVLLMIMDILINEDDNCIVAGYYNVFDVKNLSTSNLGCFNSEIVQNTLICFEHAFPARPKGFFITNTSDATELMFNLFKPALSLKLQHVTHVYNTQQTNLVYKSIPKSVLPADYGGNGHSLNHLTDYWKSKVENYGNWFEVNSTFGITNNAPIQISKNLNKLFHIPGSFRQTLQ